MTKGHELRKKPPVADVGVGRCSKAAEMTTEIAKLVLAPLDRDVSVSALSRKVRTSSDNFV